MQKLIKWQVALVPFYTLGVFLGDKYVSQSHVLALLISAAFAWLIFHNPIVRRDEVTWTVPFLFFLAASLVGLLISPFGPSAWAKGGIQLLGISIMIIMAVAIIRCLQKPEFLLVITRIMVISMGIFAVVGIAQFVLLNFSTMGRVLNFSFLNSIAGGVVWRSAGEIGGVYRANSFASESAHFVRYLGLGLGLALLRLGVVGEIHRLNISKIVPLWAAVAIVGGYVVALSIIGWLLLGITGLALFLLTGKLKIKSLLPATAAGIILLALLFGLVQQSGGALADKFGTLTLITARDVSSGVETNQISALAVAANIIVAEDNFISEPILGGGVGSHPLAYDKYAPSYVTLRPALNHLNADDAASLLVRLISEVGLLGSALFIGGCLSIIVRARKMIVERTKSSPYTWTESLSLGHAASFVGLLGIYLARTGHYYDPVFWISVALVAAIPVILKNNPATTSTI